jgi:glycosyltransferase involved in cell wall biosynthesis
MKNIFLATSRLKFYSGSEITVYEYAITLKKLGYDVVVGSLELSDFFCRKLREYNIDTIDLCEYTKEVKCDIFWCFHNNTYAFICKKDIVVCKKIVYSSLSHFEPFEIPPIFIEDIDIITVHSQENHDHLTKNYSDIIDKVYLLPNSCTDDYYMQSYQFRTKLKSIAIVSNHPPSEIQELHNDQELSFHTYGIGHDYKLVDFNELCKYDAVISIGKTVQYCLSLGIPCFCYDYFGGPGWITIENYVNAARFNYSGRCTPVKKSSHDIKKILINQYINIQSSLQLLKDYSVDTYSLRKNLSSILNLISLDNRNYRKLNFNNSNLVKRYCYINDVTIRSRKTEVYHTEYIALLESNKSKSEAEIAQISFEANEKVKLLETLNNDLTQRERTILYLNDQIAGKGQIIVDLENQLLEKKEALTGLSSEVDALRESLSWKVQQIEGLHCDISKKDNEIRMLRDFVAKRDAEISGLQRHIAEKEILISQRDHDLYHLRAYVDLVKSSWSWRLTAPLRAVQEKAKSVVQTLKRYRLAGWIIWDHRKTGIFDPQWYLQSNIDVKASGMNPWWHFAMYGIYEERSPNSSFNVIGYLTNNSDVALSLFGSVEHFVKYGWKEKRLTELCLRNIKDKNISGITSTSLLNPLMPHVHKLMELTIFEEQNNYEIKKSINIDCMHITFVIPDFSNGGGGHMNIFRMGNYLETKGHIVNYLIQNPHLHGSTEEAKKTINDSFIEFKGNILFLTDKLPRLQGDALIATDRYTCYPVRAMSGFTTKLYFVQDYESTFYPTGSESLIAEETYKMGFDCICNGEWLEKKLRNEYNLWTCCWSQSHDRNYYYPGDTALDEKIPRIAFYARHVTKRRAVELGLIAFELLYKRGFEFHVDFFGWPMENINVKYSHESHGILDAKKLGNLYRSCNLGLVFSATNHSIINKEMMACGLPVIDLDVESVKSVFPEGVLAKTEPNPTKIADTIQEILTNSSKRNSLRNKGLEYSNQFSWEESGRTFESVIRNKVSKYI